MDFISKTFKKMGKRALGICVLIVGIIGLFMPLLQGVALIVTGLIMIDLPWTRQLVAELKRRWANLRTGDSEKPTPEKKPAQKAEKDDA